MGDTATETKLSDELSSEIDAGIEATLASNGIEDNENSDNADDKTIPSDKDQSDDENKEAVEASDNGTNESDTDEDDDISISDELLERAVNAGINLSKAKSFKDAELLESMCEMLEVRGKSDSVDKSGSDEEDEDPLASIPNLDPEDYDDNIVGIVDALKNISKNQFNEIKKLKEEIGSLKDAGALNASEKEFAEKVSGLDNDYSKAIKDNPKLGSDLKKQFNVLKAGYEATGSDVSTDDVFKQAVAVVMGDVKTSVKEKQLRDRSGKFSVRPNGSKTKETTDPLDDVASAIDAKYFGKK